MGAVFDEQVAAGYESWYQTTEGKRADALEKAALRELLEGFSTASSVLEVGCGTGHFTRWLHEMGQMVAGLDLSMAMLRVTRRLNGVPLVQGDACRLPFASGTFDVTAMITTLEFVNCPKVALAEAVRVARDGVLLGVLNRWSILALRRRLSGLSRPTIYDDARFYSVAELGRLLRGVADEGADIVWRSTLFPCWGQGLFPRGRSTARLPWGGFVAMTLHRT